MKCELQPSLLPVQLHGPDQMQVQVLVQVPKPLLLPEMVLLVELLPSVGAGAGVDARSSRRLD